MVIGVSCSRVTLQQLRRTEIGVTDVTLEADLSDVFKIRRVGQVDVRRDVVKVEADRQNVDHFLDRLEIVDILVLDKVPVEKRTEEYSEILRSDAAGQHHSDEGLVGGGGRQGVGQHRTQGGHDERIRSEAARFDLYSVT